MTDHDFTRCRLPPFQHQREDTAWLVERPYAFVASQMRTGKTKIVIDAAQFLFEAGKIDKVIVVAPAPVRDVWFDESLGEIAKHAWDGLHMTVTEFHARIRTWNLAPATERSLDWYVTNYEFLRSKARLQQLMAVVGPRTWLVLDESSFVKGHKTQQTVACLQLRKACGRVALLNGTPIFHSPLDLFSQANILHPSILQCPYITQFKARYALQSPVKTFGGKALMSPWGKPVMEITGWTNLDDIERRLAPYTVRRLQAECLDLPPKLDPVTLTATLDESWPHYKSMRDELVVWLQNNQVAVAATAAIKALRLSQVTGGFLGGIEEAGIEERVDDDLLSSLDLGEYDGRSGRKSVGPCDTQRSSTDCFIPNIDLEGATNSQHEATNSQHEVGREKLDILLWFIEQQLEADPNLHLVAWSRFRAEVLRAEREVKAKFPQFVTGLVIGGQKKAERLAALALLKPETSPAGPVFVAGIEGTGSYGLDMSAAHTCVTMSGGYSSGRSAQTLDRVYGPGQTHPIAYFNIVAVGPRGQRTIDHDILSARLAGEDVATRTAQAWVKVLVRE